MILTPSLQAISDKTRVLRDRVLVKRFDYQHPVLAVIGVVLEKGVIVAIGYGRRRRRMVAFKKSQDSSAGALYFEDGEETGKIRPVAFKVGDVVEFSPRNQFKVPAYVFGEDGLVVVNEQACYGTDPTESQSSALLWQQSAGMDRHGNYLSGAEDWQREAAGKT